MSKRKPRQAASAGPRADSTAGLRKSLARRTKAELVDLLLDLAREDRGILR